MTPSWGAGDHQGDDQRHLDDRDSHRKDQDPNGSPTRWATTSAWCTADSTTLPRTAATSVTTSGGSPRSHVNANTTIAKTGATTTQDARDERVVAVRASRSHTAAVSVNPAVSWAPILPSRQQRVP